MNFHTVIPSCVYINIIKPSEIEARRCIASLTWIHGAVDQIFASEGERNVYAYTHTAFLDVYRTVCISQRVHSPCSESLFYPEPVNCEQTLPDARVCAEDTSSPRKIRLPCSVLQNVAVTEST